MLFQFPAALPLQDEGGHISTCTDDWDTYWRAVIFGAMYVHMKSVTKKKKRASGPNKQVAGLTSAFCFVG